MHRDYNAHPGYVLNSFRRLNGNPRDECHLQELAFVQAADAWLADSLPTGPPVPPFGDAYKFKVLSGL